MDTQIKTIKLFVVLLTVPHFLEIINILFWEVDIHSLYMYLSTSQKRIGNQ